MNPKEASTPAKRGSKKSTEPEWVSSGYEVGFDFGRHAGYLVFPAAAHLTHIKEGFWLDGDLQLAKLGDERWFVMPHMIKYIRKDYRKVSK